MNESRLVVWLDLCVDTKCDLVELKGKLNSINENVGELRTDDVAAAAINAIIGWAIGNPILRFRD